MIICCSCLTFLLFFVVLRCFPFSCQDDSGCIYIFHLHAFQYISDFMVCVWFVFLTRLLHSNPWQQIIIGIITAIIISITIIHYVLVLLSIFNLVSDRQRGFRKAPSRHLPSPTDSWSSSPEKPLLLL